MINLTAIQAAIESLTMLRELMLFDPLTGEDINVESLNKDNKDLYDAAYTALACLRECAERREGCDLCTPSNTISSMGAYGRKFAYCPMCGRKLERSDT